MANVAGVVNEFRLFLKRSAYSLKVPDDWLNQCADFMVQQFPNKPAKYYVDVIYQQLVDYDLGAIGATALPEDVNSMEAGFLEGTHFLQVSLCIDNTESCYSMLQKLKGIMSENALVSADTETLPSTFTSSYVAQNSALAKKPDKRNRLFTLYVTDGNIHVTVVERKPIPILNENILPGTKIELFGKIMVSGGVLFIGPENIKIIGGNVDGVTTIEYMIATIEKTLSEKPDVYAPESINEREQVATFDTSSNARAPTKPKQSQQSQPRFKNQSQESYTENRPANGGNAKNTYNQTSINVKKENTSSSYNSTSPILVSSSNKTSTTTMNQNRAYDEDEDELLMNLNPEKLVNSVNSKPKSNNQNAFNSNFNLNRQNSNNNININNKNLGNNNMKIQPIRIQQTVAVVAAADDDDDSVLIALDNYESKTKSTSSSSNNNSTASKTSISHSNAPPHQPQNAAKRLPSLNSSIDKILSSSGGENVAAKKTRSDNAPSSTTATSSNVAPKPPQFSKPSLMDHDDDDRLFTNDLHENYFMYTNHMVNNSSAAGPASTVASPAAVAIPLATLAKPTFAAQCCEAKRDVAAESPLSTCRHTINNAFFVTMRGSLMQFKHKWYQECVVGEERSSVRLDNAYVGDEPLAKLLEMSCKEAKALHRKSMEATKATGNVHNEYSLYFENKRKTCEFQMEHMTCTMRVCYDCERKMFCVVELLNVRLSR